MKTIILPKLSLDVVDKVEDILNYCSFPFQNFNTEYTLIKELETRDLFKYPISFTVNNEIDVMTSENNPTIDEKMSKAILMPIKFQFNSIFELPLVLEKKLANIEKLKNYINIRIFFCTLIVSK